MKFKNNLTELRQESGLSQEKLAKQLNISRSALSLYELGLRSPDYETLQKFADFFNVTTDYLLGRVPLKHVKEVYRSPDGKHSEFIADEEIVRKGTKNKLDTNNQTLKKYDEIEKEILIAKESGIEIDHDTATRMVENRRKYSRGLGDKKIDYIYQAKTLGDALTRLAELDLEYDFNDEIMFKLVRKAREKYGLPKAMYSEPAAHGPKFPGTGVFDEEGEEGEDN